MFTKRFFLTLATFALLLPLTGCCGGCRRNCNSNSSMAPPAARCCPQSAPLPPPGYIPGPTP